jgi:hypothetical protein
MVTINGSNNQFAIATGAHVNSAPGYSTFENPSASTSLVVTSNPGDPTPYTFQVGDSYDLTFASGGTTFTMLDATILRSDIRADGSNAIVFGGTDQNGHPVHLVWAPGADLQAWYNGVVSQGMTPRFYVTDQGTSQATFPCIVAGTRIDTPGGDCPVERLRPGDLVLTLDHGPQRLVWSGARRVCGTGNAAPVRFPAGSVGNHRDLWLSRRHRVLLSGPLVDLWFGVPEVLAPAAGWIGHCGVRAEPLDSMVLVHLLFPRHEVVRAEGAAVESLLLAPESLADLAAVPGILIPDDASARCGVSRPDFGALARRGIATCPARPILKPAEVALVLSAGVTVMQGGIAAAVGVAGV